MIGLYSLVKEQNIDHGMRKSLLYKEYVQMYSSPGLMNIKVWSGLCAVGS